MAFRTQKISQMTPKGANLEATDLIEVSTIESGSYVTRSITGQEIIDAAVGNVDWGDIGGTLSAQTDLQNALNAKENTITAGTTSQYFRGDKTFQTLDKAAVGLGNVDNTSDANKPISTATQTALNAKQNTLSLTTTGSSGASTLVGSTLNIPNYTLSGLGGVPTSRTLTINGVTQDLSADRTFTISTGITIGSTAITSGVVGRVLFEGAGNVVQESSSLFWDNTNVRLGVGTSTPTHSLTISQDGYNLRLANSASTNGYNIGRNNSNGLLYFYGDQGTFNGYVFDGINGERMRIAGSTGNVLINTTTDAGFRLDVNGTARVQGNLTLGINSNTALSASVRNSNSGSSSSTEINIGNDLNQFIGSLATYSSTFSTQYVRNNLCLVSYAYDVLIGTNLNVASGGANVIKFSTGGSNAAQERMRIFSTGNIGINTTTDAGFRLDVNGTARVKGTGTTSATTAFTVQNSAGSTNLQVTDDQVIKGYTNATLKFQLGNTQAGISTRATGALCIGFIDVNLQSGLQINALGTGKTYIDGWNDGGTSQYDIVVGAQGSRVQFGTDSTSVASAQVTINSTTRGFLPPRMTTTQKNAIASPAAGLMVYDTTLNVISYYNGSMWI